MKRCPRCERTFPDTEKFCGDDGTELVAAAARTAPVEVPPADAPSGPDRQIECPVCGGKAEPGEVICNFCGARLDQTTAPPSAQSPGMFRTQTMATPPPPPPRQTGATLRVDPSHSFDDESPLDGGGPPSRGIMGIIGYIVAALVALGGGVWLALHLSSHGAAVARSHRRRRAQLRRRPSLPDLPCYSRAICWCRSPEPRRWRPNAASLR